MPEQSKITLSLSADDVRRFCREITHGTSNINRKHAALIALEGFIGKHAGADSHSPLHNEILGVVRSFSEETRSKLLDEQANELALGLQKMEVETISRVFRSISRNGFHEVAKQILANLSPGEVERAARWVTAWCEQAEASAKEASGYPDAMNFAAAGIPLADYQALTDIRRVLPT